MPGGLAGLAFVPQGYDTGGQQYLALQAAERDKAALALLGQTFQGMTLPQPGGGAPPGAGGPVMAGGPPGPPGAPPGAPPVSPMPGQPTPPGLSPPPVPGGPPPTIQGQRGVLPPGWLGGGSAAAPTGGMGGAPAVPGGPAGAGPATPGGVQAPMSWQDLATRIVQANPKAPPDVIAAAITKAMPLLNADSQQQWRQIQAYLAQERVDQAGRSLDERTRYHESEEGLRQQNLDLRKESAQSKSENAAQQREEARRRLDQGGDRLDQAARKSEMDSYLKAHRLWQQSMNAQIQIAVNVPGSGGAAEAKRLREELKQGIDEFNRHWAELQQATTARSQNPVGVTPTPSQDQKRSALSKGGMTVKPPQPLPPDREQKLQELLQKDPSQKGAAVEMLQRQGYAVPGWLLQ